MIKFKDIPSHMGIKKYFIGVADNNNIPHAHLLSGKEGSAALPLALSFNMYIHCTNKINSDACGNCISCNMVKNSIHPDTQFIYPAYTTKYTKDKNDSPNIFLEKWRNFIKKTPYPSLLNWSAHIDAGSKQLNIGKNEVTAITKNLNLPPIKSPYKIIIIWLPEYFTIVASNAILKILEEPPKWSIFLLVTINTYNIPETILSRLQQINISLFTDKEIKFMLKPYIHTHKEEINIEEIVQLSEGNFNKAVALLNDRSQNYFSNFQLWMRAVYKKDFSLLLQYAEDFYTTPKEEQKQILLHHLYITRKIILVKYQSYAEDKYGKKNAPEFYKNIGNKLAYNKIKHLINLLNNAIYNIERNANGKILHFNLSLDILEIFKK